MKAFTILYALGSAALVSGCISSTAFSSNQRPQIDYKGDSPEAARLKDHALCLKAAWETNAPSGEAICDQIFRKDGL